MEFKNKRNLSILGILIILIMICAASAYAYSDPVKTSLATIVSVFAVGFAPLYCFGKGIVEKKQQHIGVQILISLIIPFIWVAVSTYRWYSGLPPLTAGETPLAAFGAVWIEAFVFFLMGVMFAVGGCYTDRIVEKLKNIGKNSV
ncbi:hypothetical protein MmiAt1_07440 [Methanimicrococcus sp. At1]|uniref:Uncharacterized protein n=1 Tax=Methanimicrococcus hacksteinii TaxID=3028293 RepID=A0ABU3VP53_9EURY|nr:hypothetical protein [Methanimicrococcus sp. At1]MDV0445187.1 hypothetical protein [Methanimicrococcus sp. At1]